MSSKKYEVLLTSSAERDLESIYDHIANSDSLVRANYVLDQLTETCKGLTRFPNRGICPHELVALGLHNYRQTFFRPYRVIYEVVDRFVYVHLIVDGRRNMQVLLAQRLLSH